MVTFDAGKEKRDESTHSKVQSEGLLEVAWQGNAVYLKNSTIY